MGSVAWLAVGLVVASVGCAPGREHGERSRAAPMSPDAAPADGAAALTPSLSFERTRTECRRDAVPPRPFRVAADAGVPAADGGAPILPELGCDEGDTCVFPDQACGRESDGIGDCLMSPPCSSDSGPVCGCDGLEYESECEALMRGVDVDRRGQCALAPGTFVCGAEPCVVGEETCFGIVSHINGGLYDVRCEPIPDECSETDPECVCEGLRSCELIEGPLGMAVYRFVSDW